MPEVSFDSNFNSYKIIGNATNASPDAFFNELNSVLTAEIEKNNKLSLSIEIEKLNVICSKRLLFLFYNIQEAFNQGKDISITWIANNYEMHEIAEDYAFMLNFPIKIIAL